MMNRKLAEFQKKQADDKNREREEDFMREMNEAEIIRNAIETDEKLFNTYAKRCLEEWEHQVGDSDSGQKRDSDRP
jgi:hypothetical protein